MGVNKVVTDEMILEAVPNAQCMSHLLRDLGFRQTGGKSATVMRKRLVDLGITDPHFFSTSNKVSRLGKKAKTLDEMLVENSTYKRYQLIKKKLIAAGMKKDECEVCGIGNQWNGKPIVLQVDHINGINDDNRLENLQIICPNCHSQTSTFGRGTSAKLNRTCACGAGKSADALVCWPCYIKSKENKNEQVG